VTVGLYVHMAPKPGKEAEVENFLRAGLSVVQQEPATSAWFALRMTASASSTFFRRGGPRGASRGPRRRGAETAGRRPVQSPTSSQPSCRERGKTFAEP
jgi:hypothetical protein